MMIGRGMDSEEEREEVESTLPISEDGER